MRKALIVPVVISCLLLIGCATKFRAEIRRYDSKGNLLSKEVVEMSGPGAVESDGKVVKADSKREPLFQKVIEKGSSDVMDYIILKEATK